MAMTLEEIKKDMLEDYEDLCYGYLSEKAKGNEVKAYEYFRRYHRLGSDIKRYFDITDELRQIRNYVRKELTL